MGKYSHLSLEERKKIYQLDREGLCISAIARSVGRSKSCISREINRNIEEIGYLPDTAEKKYRERRSHRKKKDKRIKRTHGILCCQQNERALVPFIYGDTGKALSLYRLLRYQQSKRGQVYSRKHRSETIKGRVSIHQRPSDIADRLNVGDFEGDLTFFHANRST